MGDTYNVGQAGAVGRDAKSESATFNQLWSPVSAEQQRQVLNELLEVREFLAARGTTEDEKDSVRALDLAHDSISKGDYSSGSSHLRRAGRWALGAATSVGAGVATAAIKAATGL